MAPCKEDGMAVHPPRGQSCHVVNLLSLVLVLFLYHSSTGPAVKNED